MNLGICPLELVFEKPKLMCAVKISPNIYVHVVELSFKGSIPSLFYGTGIDWCTSSRFKFKSYICSSIVC
jgi:hypothetical protein